MTTRTSQDLLAERRANVQEARRERDETARLMLLAHVAVIDAELERRRKPTCWRCGDEATTETTCGHDWVCDDCLPGCSVAVSFARDDSVFCRSCLVGWDERESVTVEQERHAGRWMDGR